MTRALNATPEEQERLRRAAESPPAPSPAAAGPDSADVEKAARAIRAAEFCGVGWEEDREENRAEYRRLAVAALEAVRPSPDSEAVARVEALIAVAPVMWHGDYPVKAVPVSDLLSVLAAPVPHDADGGERR